MSEKYLLYLDSILNTNCFYWPNVWRKRAQGIRKFKNENNRVFLFYFQYLIFFTFFLVYFTPLMFIPYLLLPIILPYFFSLLFPLLLPFLFFSIPSYFTTYDSNLLYPGTWITPECKEDSAYLQPHGSGVTQICEPCLCCICNATSCEGFLWTAYIVAPDMQQGTRKWNLTVT